MKILITLMMALALPASAEGVEEEEINEEVPWGNNILIVNITGFENNSGMAVVALFTRDEWSFPLNPDQGGTVRTVDIDNLAVNAEIADVPDGTYAAMAFHDENGNGRFDEDDEMMGISGDMAQMHSMGGPPSFDDICFTLDRSTSAIRIIVRKMERPTDSREGMPGGRMPGGGGRPF